MSYIYCLSERPSPDAIELGSWADSALTAVGVRRTVHTLWWSLEELPEFSAVPSDQIQSLLDRRMKIPTVDRSEIPFGHKVCETKQVRITPIIVQHLLAIK